MSETSAPDTRAETGGESSSGPNLGLRVALLALALLGALLVVQALQDDKEPSTASTGTTPTEDTESVGTVNPDEAFDPGVGGTRVDTETTPEAPKPAPELEFDVKIEGTPVTDGQTVDLTLRHVKGSVLRHRIVIDQARTDRAAQTTEGQRRVLWVKSEVLDVRKDGSASVSLQVEDLYFHAYIGELTQFAYDSRNPDEELLRTPGVAEVLAGLLSTLDLPLEFDVDATGRATAVHGVERWAEAISESISLIRPDADVTTIQPDTVLFFYRELLFPGLAGGKINVPETREFQFAADSTLGYDVTVDGRWRVTCDDPEGYVVSAVGKHDSRRRTGPAPTRSAARIAGYRVVSDAESYSGRWQVLRSPAAVAKANLEAKYQQWVSFGTDESAQRHFHVLEQRTQVELLSNAE